MVVKPTCVFPTGTSPVREGKEWFLLHTRYSRRYDTLYILYKNIETGEKVLDEIQGPHVPVFLAKQMPNFFEEYVPYQNTYPIMVSQRNKSKEIQMHLFPTRTWKYYDKVTQMEKTQVGFVGMKPDTLKKKPEYLHPQLLFADVPIEHLVYMEYCIHRYDDVGEGIRMEVINKPNIDYASFDIETSIDEFGNPYVNTLTFIDDKSMTAYLLYLQKDAYKNQEFIKNNPEEFNRLFREKLKWAIENMTLDAKPDKIAYIKDICNEYLDKLKLVTKEYATEQELIWNSCDIMFTKNSPDLLLAFNTGFDIPMLQRRITELGMMPGTLNSHEKKSWTEMSPPVSEDLNEFWQLRNDTIDPKKRSTAFDNISKTHIVDYANAYYSNRKGATFSSMSLDATAERTVGLGKLDYSHICNHILKLPFSDFVTHGVYALIDSLLLVILEKVTNDFASKLSYGFRCKTDMKTTASNNQAITRCIHSDAFFDGNVAYNNWKKYLNSFTKEELTEISGITKIDYTKLIKLYANLPGKTKGDIKGGIVGNPNKVKLSFPKIGRKFNILEQEVSITRFKKFLKSIYYDAKSHYPNAFVTRNIAIATMFGDLVSLIRNGETVQTARWKDKGTENYIPHMGGINLTLVNRDPIAFGEKVMGLPGMGAITAKFVPVDSEPKFKPIELPNFSVDIKSHKDIQTLTSTLKELNTDKISDSENKNGIIDASSTFLINNGETTFLRTFVNFNYSGITIADKLGIENGEPLLAKKTNATTLTVNNYLYVQPVNRPPVFSGEFTEFTDDDMERINDADMFTTEVHFGGLLAYVPKFQLYFPFKTYFKCLDGGHVEDGGHKKHVIVSKPKYRVLERHKTFSTEIVYTIEFKDYSIAITQIIDWIKL